MSPLLSMLLNLVIYQLPQRLLIVNQPPGLTQEEEHYHQLNNSPIQHEPCLQSDISYIREITMILANTLRSLH